MATVIGGGGFTEVVDPIATFTQEEEALLGQLDEYAHSQDPFYYESAFEEPTKNEDITGVLRPELSFECDPVEINAVIVYAAVDLLYNTIYANTNINIIEDDIYFYHGDHLGSANWITDSNGDAISNDLNKE